MHFIYIVECKDGTLYTGYTNNLEKRIIAHNEGKGAKYTRGRAPVTLRYYEQFELKSEAMKREAEVKKLKRNKKIELLMNFYCKVKEYIE